MSERDRVAWCWSTHLGATCVIIAGHKGGHAGFDLDGQWRRWTDDDVAAELDAAAGVSE